MRIPGAIAVVLIGVTSLAWAHHERVVFDSAKMVNVSGTIMKIEWANPHVQVYVDQKDVATGKVQSWRIEMEKPAALQEQGLGQNSFRPGSDITVVGVPPIRGGLFLWPFEVKLADGHRWSAQITYR